MKNSEEQSSWLKSWLKPSNLIALAGLIAAIWGGVTIFNKTQEVNAEKNCEVSQVKLKAGDKNISSSQKVNCSEDSKVTDVTVE